MKGLYTTQGMEYKSTLFGCKKYNTNTAHHKHFAGLDMGLELDRLHFVLHGIKGKMHEQYLDIPSAVCIRMNELLRPDSYTTLSPPDQRCQLCVL